MISLSRAYTPTIPTPRFSGLVVLLGACVAGLSACAPKLAPLPSGPGTPFSDYTSAYTQAMETCRGVRTFAGVLDLSGRAEDTRIRVRVNAGFASPGQIRLEGLPPALAFGRPLFILVGRAGDAMLVLPRDRRVLTNAPTEEIIEALAGVSLTADELRATVSGCGVGVGSPTGGRSYQDGWMAVDAGDTTTWLRNVNGSWRPSATIRGPLEIRYEEFAGTYPTRIRIRTAPVGSTRRTDLTLRVSDVDINTELGPEVFTADVPEGATPLTLDELRRSRPGSSGDSTVWLEL